MIVASMDEAERNRWIQYKRSRNVQLRNAFIEQYIPLVKYCVHKVMRTLPADVSPDDLTQWGSIGLLRAVQNYDAARQIEFKTFAMQRIQGAMLDGLRETDPIKRVNRKQLQVLERLRAEAATTLGRDANEYEVAEVSGISESRMGELRQIDGFISLSTVVKDGEDFNRVKTLAEEIIDGRTSGPTQRTRRKAFLKHLCKSLNKTERLVVLLYYYEHLTFREIGESLHLCESRISQLHSRIMSRLRKTMQRSDLAELIAP